MSSIHGRNAKIIIPVVTCARELVKVGKLERKIRLRGWAIEIERGRS